MLWRIRTSPGIGKALEAGGEGSSDVVPALADPPQCRSDAVRVGLGLRVAPNGTVGVEGAGSESQLGPFAYSSRSRRSLLPADPRVIQKRQWICNDSNS
jgi:hypothetical protein